MSRNVSGLNAAAKIVVPLLKIKVARRDVLGPGEHGDTGPAALAAAAEPGPPSNASLRCWPVARERTTIDGGIPAFVDRVVNMTRSVPDSDPALLDYPVIGNNKARVSISWFMTKLKAAIEAGKAQIGTQRAPKAETPVATSDPVPYGIIRQFVCTTARRRSPPFLKGRFARRLPPAAASGGNR